MGEGGWGKGGGIVQFNYCNIDGSDVIHHLMWQKKVSVITIFPWGKKPCNVGFAATRGSDAPVLLQSQPPKHILVMGQ